MYANMVRCSTDVETTFGTTQVESWTDQRLIEGTFTPKLSPNSKLPDQSTVDYLHDRESNREGSKYGSGFTASFYLDGLADRLDDAEAYSHPEAPIGEILAAFMGGEDGDSGTTELASGSSTTALTVAVGEGARWSANGGGAVISGGELRPVASVAADTITLAMALTSAPTNGDDIFNVAHYYLDRAGVGGDGESLVFRLVGEDAEDQYLFLGCGGTFQIVSNLDELLRLDVDVTAAQWDRVSSESLTGITYGGGGPLPCVAGKLLLATTGSTVVTELTAPEFKIDPGLAITQSRGLGGIETVYRHYQQRANPTISFFIAHDHSAFHTYLDAFSGSGLTTRQEYQLLLQVGTTPRDAASNDGTGVVGFYLPNAMFGASPERVTGPNGLDGIRFSFEGRARQGAGSVPNALRDSPLHIYCG